MTEVQALLEIAKAINLLASNVGCLAIVLVAFLFFKKMG